MLINIIQGAPISTSVLLSIFIGAIIVLCYRWRNRFDYWEKRGVKGPKPWPVVGNLLQLLAGDRMKRERDWARLYGKLYGIYLGSKAQLVISDAEVLQQICVKHFDAFPNHEVNEFFNHYQKSFLFFLQDDRWKRIRAIMSPTFTSGKIKRMFKFLDVCADDLINCFEEQIEVAANKLGRDHRPKVEVNVKDVYNLFTMDAITTCCYGLELERVAGSSDLKSAATRNDFVRLAMKIFNFSFFRFIIFVITPKSILRLLGFKVSTSEKYVNLAKVVEQLVDRRRSKSRDTSCRYDDYLQLLVDAKLDDEMDLTEMDLEENHHAGLTHESLRQDQRKLAQELELPAADSQVSANKKQQQVLSEIEIVSGAMFLLVVGLETTSSLLANCTYLLAFNQDAQERLYEEVRKIAEFREDDKTRTMFTYEALTSCRYLDSVISETLRLFTPVLVIDRISKFDYYIKKYNVHLPKGSKVTLALHAIMNDPDYWPEPEKFNPDRFSPENKEKIVPGSYCPFGIGPRHCLGMRFSLTETKLALAKTIMRYRIEPADGTKFPPELKLSFGLANMKRPHVVLSPRS